MAPRQSLGMLRFRDAPISRKLTLAFMIMSVSAVMLVSVVFLAYDWYTERKSIADDLASLSEVIGNNSTAALSFNDPVTANEVLGALRARPFIEIACIYDLNSAAITPFAFYVREGLAVRCPARPLGYGIDFTNQYMTITKPIYLDDQKIGSLYLRKNLDQLWNSLGVHAQVIVVVVVVSLGLSLLAAALMQRVITRPILTLAVTAQNITESKDYALRAPTSGRDEVGQLISNFNSMLSEIETRDDEVRNARKKLQEQVEQTTRAYHELQQTMHRLKETQRQLVQTEKMASLGGLVAGVAHEINTPVGVGVTAASTLLDSTRHISDSYEHNELTESALRKYIDTASQSSEIILSNLARAAELIHSFKQVAVDQTSSDRRQFELSGYLNEILLSLRPRLKKTQHTVNIECPQGLLVDTYPGALSQIITNLILNSLIHGFENREQGSITISAGLEDGNIHLHYKDDGVGIPEEHQSRVFDPFFTTKRGLGGSGLGLHVVYNLVSHTLNGNINMQSTPGKGTAYEIIFPAQEGISHEQKAS